MYLGLLVLNGSAKRTTTNVVGNPFPVKKYGLNECLRLYEEHIRDTPSLYFALEELEGKELGCWCKPNGCHGDILVKLLEERKLK